MHKVYGDRPNALPLRELETRYEIEESHPYYAAGIDEQMSIDASLHSVFGVSKTAADLMVQEFGRNFGLRSACFRGGCLTGPAHSGAELHGFLAYLMQCALTGRQYTVFGYKGKQVRDNIHSRDVVRALWEFYQRPARAKVYNLGGGRFANCSVIEAIELCEELVGQKVNQIYSRQHRVGDHLWYISDMGRFKADYPEWSWTTDLRNILIELKESLLERARRPAGGAGVTLCESST